MGIFRDFPEQFPFDAKTTHVVLLPCSVHLLTFRFTSSTIVKRPYKNPTYNKNIFIIFFLDQRAYIRSHKWPILHGRSNIQQYGNNQTHPASESVWQIRERFTFLSASGGNHGGTCSRNVSYLRRSNLRLSTSLVPFNHAALGSNQKALSDDGWVLDWRRKEPGCGRQRDERSAL